MNTNLIIANWKMNPVKPTDAKKIFTGIQKGVRGIQGVDVVVCPPSIFIPELSKIPRTKNVTLGVQDLFYEESGARTGQTSPAMARAYKVTWAILGHSERRELGETNDLVARKVSYAISEGHTAVLCVGERVRAEDGSYYTFVREELEPVLAGLQRKDLAKLVIAYEPIWAIGKSAAEAMQSRDLHEMVLFIRKVLTEKFGRAPAARVPILYGGAVKPENAEEIMRDGGVNGLLVGSASLNPKAFTAIVKASRVS
jgi:triosephosphate isomerase